MLGTTSYSIAICGHAKHGKSTLAGRLIYEFGAVSSATLEKYEREAQQRGKDFNKFSLMFLQHRPDTFQRQTGDMDDLSRSVFPARGSAEFAETRLTIIDTPGFTRFLDNIIYGIHLSDLAIVVIEAGDGVKRGTEAVCRILQAFEVRPIAFCVTKMDMVKYKEANFRNVEGQVRDRLINRYAGDEVPIIPVSAIDDVGFSERDDKMPWYLGPSLLSILRRARMSREVESTSHVRLVVQGAEEVFYPPGVGTVIVGALESGTLKPGQLLLAEPASTIQKKEVSARLRSVHLARGVTDSKPHPVDEALARAIVAVNVPSWSRGDASSYFRGGGVLGTSSNRPRVAVSILADVVFFEPETVYAGKEYVIGPHAALTTGYFLEIVDASTVVYDLRKDEYNAYSGESVRARIQFRKPCCIEPLSEFPRLSRFVVRESNRITACGTCVEIIEAANDNVHGRHNE
jgi:elongation factor 1-alpha